MNFGKAFTAFFAGLFLTTSVFACTLFRSNEPGYAGELNEQEEKMLEQVIEKRIEKPQEEPGSKWGKDSATAVKKYSLYIEYYKQENYKDAYPYWRYLYKNAPRQSENLYIHGVKMIEEHKIKDAPDEKVKEAYIDTLLMVYDQRIKYFNSEGEVLARKGIDLITHRSNDYPKAYELFKSSLEKTGNDALSAVPYYYIYSSALLNKSGKITKEQLLNDYEKASEVINYNLNKDPGSTKWSQVQTYVEGAVRELVTCEDLINIYKPRFEKAKDNAEALKRIESSLANNNCADHPFALQISTRLFELDPASSSAYFIGKSWEKKGELNKAESFYKKALELERGNGNSGSYALSLASLYKDMGNYPMAKTYAKKALEYSPANGKAYIFLGDLYAMGAKQCGGSDDFARQAVYWVVVDQYLKARSVDASVADIANSRINQFRIQFPSKDDAFFRSVKEGDTYTVECWINESTNVRFNQ